MTTDAHRPRWLPIGDFAAATQLSLKALRLYAEQQLLVPARVDDTTGYRYYRSDQVAKGRLIRTLREMRLSLADIGAIVSVDDVAARRLLNAFANEQDQRYAREKRAYRAALMQLQPVTSEGTAFLGRSPRVADWLARMGARGEVAEFRALLPPRAPIEHARLWANAHRPGIRRASESGGQLGIGG